MRKQRWRHLRLGIFLNQGTYVLILFAYVVTSSITRKPQSWIHVAADGRHMDSIHMADYRETKKKNPFRVLRPRLYVPDFNFCIPIKSIVPPLIETTPCQCCTKWCGRLVSRLEYPPLCNPPKVRPRRALRPSVALNTCYVSESWEVRRCYLLINNNINRRRMRYSKVIQRFPPQDSSRAVAILACILRHHKIIGQNLNHWRHKIFSYLWIDFQVYKLTLLQNGKIFHFFWSNQNFDQYRSHGRKSHIRKLHFHLQITGQAFRERVCWLIL